MKFKTTLQDIANTVEKIKGIGFNAYIGSNGLFDSATVKAYAAELQNLSRVQAEASLSVAGLSKAQREQILSSLEFVSVAKALTAEQIQESLATELNNAEDAKALLIRAGIITQKQLEENATIEVTSAKLNESVVNGTLSATDASVIAGALGITGANTSATISFKVFTAAIWANIVALTKWLTTNPVGWCVLAVSSILGLVKAYDHFTVSTEEAMESLDETSQTFNDATSNLESLNNELQTTSDRIKELQALADNGTISTAEQDELDSLKKQNDELERNIVLKRQEQALAAKKELKDLENADLSVKSKYKVDYHKLNRKDATVNTARETVSRNEEAGYTQEHYDELQKKIDELNQKEKKLREKNPNLTNDKKGKSKEQVEYNNTVDNLKHYQKELKETENYFEELYNDDVKKKLSAYQELVDNDFSLGANQEEYESLMALQDAYLMHCYRIQQSADAYKALNAEQQKSVLLDKLKEKGYTDEQAQSIVNTIKEDDLDKYYTADFNFSLPDVKDYDGKLADWSKDFVKIWGDHVSEESNGESVELSPSISFDQAWEKLKSVGEDAKDLTADLLALASAGKLTPDILLSNEEYADLLQTVSNNADVAAQKINKMVHASDQLASMKSGISSISNVLAEKKENLSNKKTRDVGISADTLSGFDAEIKGLESWKKFEETLGNGKSKMAACQKAANELATEWVNSNNFLSQLNNTNKAYYISTLKEMGVKNAEAVVTDRLNNKTEILNSEKEAQNNLEKAAAENKVNLNNLTWEMVESSNAYTDSSNYAKAALAELYMQENIFNNTKLDANQKIKALNELTAAYAGTAVQAQAMQIYQDTFSKEMEKSHGTNIASASKKALKAKEKFQRKAIRDTLKLDVEVDPNTTNPDSGGSGSGSGSKNKSTKDSTTQSTQVIDWIERRLSVLQSAIDKTKASLGNLFNLDSKQGNIDKQIKQTTKLMEAQAKAAEKYQKKADSVKLSGKLKKKVKNGQISGNLSELIATYGEKTANKISKYQDYIDKAKDARRETDTLLSSVIELNNQKLDNITSWYDTFIEKIGSVQSKIQSKIDLTSKIRGLLGQAEVGSVKNYQNLMGKQSKEISKTKTERDKAAVQYDENINRTVKAMQKAGAKQKDINEFKKQANAKKDTALNGYDAQINQIYGDMLDTASAMANIPYENAKIQVERLSDALNNLSVKINTLSGDMSISNNVFFAKSFYESENRIKSQKVRDLSYSVSSLQTLKNSYANQLINKGINPLTINSASDLTGIEDWEVRNIATSYLATVNSLSQANKDYEDALIDFRDTIFNNAKKISEVIDSFYDSNRDKIANDREIKSNQYEVSGSLDEKVNLIMEDSKLAKDNLHEYDKQIEEHDTDAADLLTYVDNILKEEGKSSYVTLLSRYFGYNAFSSEQNDLSSVDDFFFDYIYNMFSKLDINEENKNKILDYLTRANANLIARDETETKKSLEESALPITLQENFVKIFNVIAEAYDRSVQSIEDNIDQLNNAISLAEANGKFITAQYYESIGKEQQKELSALQDKSKGLQEQLEKGLADGSIKEGSDAWYDLTRQIIETNKEIDSMNVSIAETAKNARQAKRDLNDWARGAIDTINGEADFYQKLVSREKQFDDNGSLTDYGKANIALSLEKMSNDIAKNQSLVKDIQDLNEEYANDKTNKEYLDRLKELNDMVYANIDAYYEQRDAIKSLVEEGLNAELDALDELINKYTEALDEAASLRDFERQITDITKRRDSLMKQKKALEGNDSEEARAKLQAINVELQEAQQDLDDAYYDKYIEDQKAILQDMNDDMQSFIEGQFEHLDTLVNQLVQGISGEGDSIYSILNELAGKWDLDMSKELADSVQKSDYTKTPTAENPNPSSNAGQNAKDAKEERLDVEYKKKGACDDDERERYIKKGASDDDEQDIYSKKGASDDDERERSYTKKGASDDDERESNTSSPLDIILNGVVLEDRNFHNVQNAVYSGNKEFDKLFGLETNGCRLDRSTYNKLLEYYGLYPNTPAETVLERISEDVDFKKFHISKNKYGKNDIIYDGYGIVYNGGFASGGIGQLVRKSGEDGIAFVRNGEGFVSPEDVPKIQALLDTVPAMKNLMDTITPLHSLPAPASQQKSQSVQIGTIQQTFELPNVTDTDSFIKEVKTNPKMGRFMDDLVYSRMTGDISKVTHW